MSESGENGTAVEPAPTSDTPQEDPVPPTESKVAEVSHDKTETAESTAKASEVAVPPLAQSENPPSKDSPEKAAKSEAEGQPVKPKWKPTPIDVSDLIAEKPKTAATESDKAADTPKVEDARTSIGRSRSRGRRGRSRSPARRERALSTSELQRERVRASRGHPHCLECNLQFVTGKSEKLHRESQRHQAVLKKDKPFTDTGVTTDFNCFLCWNAFVSLEPLREHYKSEEHVQRLKRYGVERLLVEEKPRHFATSTPRERSDRASSRKRERSPVFVRWKDYLLLDEYPQLAPDPSVTAKNGSVKATSEPPVEAHTPKETSAPLKSEKKPDEGSPPAKIAKTVSEDQVEEKKADAEEVETPTDTVVEAKPFETVAAEEVETAS